MVEPRAKVVRGAKSDRLSLGDDQPKFASPENREKISEFLKIIRIKILSYATLNVLKSFRFILAPVDCQVYFAGDQAEDLFSGGLFDLFHSR